jgi:hypothetical protein
MRLIYLIRANPSKDGDAKPRVYNCESGHDSQVAEDENINMIFASLAQNQALLFESFKVRSIKANPLKNGDAKPRV